MVHARFIVEAGDFGTERSDQLRGSARPVSDLGRSLRFGVVAGALSVLASEGAIDEATARASLVAAVGTGKKFERMWDRFTAQAEAT